jgi:hypothetical protein
MGANNEVELLVAKWPGGFVTDIALDPGLFEKPLPVSPLMSDTAKRLVEPASFERLRIQYPLGTIEWAGPASNIEYLILWRKKLEDPGNVWLVHGGCCALLRQLVDAPERQIGISHVFSHAPQRSRKVKRRALEIQ